MEMFLQQVLNGLTLGGIYGLVALGLTLVYGILQLQAKIKRPRVIQR